MQRTTTINPRYDRLFQRNALYMPLKPKYRPKKRTSVKARSMVTTGRARSTSRLADPKPPRFLSQVPVNSSEQKFYNMYLDNTPYTGNAVSMGLYLLDRIDQGPGVSQRLGQRYKVDAILMRFNIKMLPNVTRRHCGYLVVHDNAPNLALPPIFPNILQTAGAGGVPAPAMAFTGMSFKDRFTVLDKQLFTLGSNVDQGNPVGSNELYFERYVTVPPGEKYSSTCSVGGGPGIDARVRGACYLLPFSDDLGVDNIIGDVNLRVYFHDV